MVRVEGEHVHDLEEAIAPGPTSTVAPNAPDCAQVGPGVEPPLEVPHPMAKPTSVDPLSHRDDGHAHAAVYVVARFCPRLFSFFLARHSFNTRGTSRTSSFRA